MIIAKNIIKTFINGPVVTPVLKGIDVEIVDGEFVAIMGKSGAGKSTLMYQLSLLDRPTEGDITVDGYDILSMNDKERTNFRLQYLGYVFQDYALLPEMTAIENVMIPTLMQGQSPRDARMAATKALERVGLGDRLSNRPSQLSGGEQQRVSIARAVAHNPVILFADEPTANLDSVSGMEVLRLFEALRKEGQTIVMVTHEKEYTYACDRVIQLEDGLIESITKKQK
ncbi:MAG: putative ABC transport system ATP-binding protein [Planctomycetota bacterium]|jgi:putative ABC transport system ATP-binding protein